MQLDENCLLCNPLFHDRFCKTTEVLALVLAAAPFSARLDELLDKTRLGPKELLDICHALRRAGFIRQHDVFAANWVLCASAAHLTLEDVFFCVAREFNDGKPGIMDAPVVDASTSGRVNAFLMQASIETNQCFLKELRRFSLARLWAGRSTRVGGGPPEHSLAPKAAQAMADAEAR